MSPLSFLWVPVGCAHLAAAPPPASPGELAAPPPAGVPAGVGPAAEPVDGPATLRALATTPVAGGPDTGDLSRICVDVSPLVGAAHRVGVGDPYAVRNPPSGWRHVETFTFPVFNQVLAFRADPPRSAAGSPPASQTGAAMGLTQITTWRDVAGERLQIRCLGESGQREALQRACDTLAVRACG